MKKKADIFGKDDRGFSLVELIIVIAIMAILIGVVGMQVIPYMNNSKKAKDLQILSAYATAGVVAYASHADDAPESGSMTVVIVSDGSADTFTATPATAQSIADEMKYLVAKNYVTDASTVFASREYSKTEKIIVTFDFDSGEVTVVGNDGTADIPNDNEVLAVLK